MPDGALSFLSAKPDVFEPALAAHLLARGLIDDAGLARGRRSQEASGDRLHGVLTRLALVTECHMAAALAAVLGERLVTEAEYPAEPVPGPAMGLRFLKEARLIPLSAESETLVIAMADPFDGFAIQAVQLRFRRAVVVAHRRPGRDRSGHRPPLCRRQDRHGPARRGRVLLR